MFLKSSSIPCFKKLLSTGSVIIFTEPAAIMSSMFCNGNKLPLNIVHVFSCLVSCILRAVERLDHRPYGQSSEVFPRLCRLVASHRAAWTDLKLIEWPSISHARLWAHIVFHRNSPRKPAKALLDLVKGQKLSRWIVE
jgi:hypothetical protein